MKKLYDELSFLVSKATTEKYSTSFSLGILALHSDIRPAIYAIYGYVRLADEIVDSFHDYNKGELLQQFIDQTNEALTKKISLNPILHSFQQTVHDYKIDTALIHQFLHSMQMDLNKTVYDKQTYDEYILGSAEVVGLMCLKIFVKSDENEYQRLKPFAMNLGSAFQKVNFLRDLKDDYQLLGRTYFPDINLEKFNNDSKLAIEADIQKEFTQALVGIKQLPASSRFGVFLAYRYYLSLLNKIKKADAAHIKHTRVRIANPIKLALMCRSYIKYKITLNP